MVFEYKVYQQSNSFARKTFFITTSSLKILKLNSLRPDTSAQTFLVSLCLQVNAEMVSKTPGCYCMLSCSPPDLNFLVPYVTFMYMLNNPCHRVTAQLQLIKCYYNKPLSRMKGYVSLFIINEISTKASMASSLLSSFFHI